MAIRGILLDKDGTLVDFFRTWIPAYRAAADLASRAAGEPALGDRLLRLTGYDPTTGQLDPASLLAGGTTQEICDLWAIEAGVADRPGLSRELRHAMEARVSAHPIPVGEGLVNLLGRLVERGFILGIATMDGETVARSTADALGIAGSLSFVSGFDSGFAPKPAPDMVHGFCTATGLAAGDIMVVGDTSRDIEMARAAGVARAVAVLTGATPVEALSPIADIVIESVLDIESILG
ncbi:MAG: HAD family hydrolase [Rhodospirillales bacterium]|nr:MAG: HAD family hydrolase [Rhodospirillales bacterium]